MRKHKPRTTVVPEFVASSARGNTTGKGFLFTAQQYGQFRTFLNKLVSLPGNEWPPTDQWPYFDGLPPYEIALYRPPVYGNPYLVIRFSHRRVIIPVSLFSDKIGRRWKFGRHSKDFQPQIPMF